jgi:hypothetical protein
MAVCKQQVSEQGYVTNYHKFTEVTVSDSTLIGLLTSYVTKEYREMEKPALSRNYYFNITIEEEESMGIRQLAYKKLKELPEWADAEDC